MFVYLVVIGTNKHQSIRSNDWDWNFTIFFLLSIQNESINRLIDRVKYDYDDNNDFQHHLINLTSFFSNLNLKKSTIKGHHHSGNNIDWCPTTKKKQVFFSDFNIDNNQRWPNRKPMDKFIFEKNEKKPDQFSPVMITITTTMMISSVNQFVSFIHLVIQPASEKIINQIDRFDSKKRIDRLFYFISQTWYRQIIDLNRFNRFSIKLLLFVVFPQFSIHDDHDNRDHHRKTKRHIRSDHW